MTPLRKWMLEEQGPAFSTSPAHLPSFPPVVSTRGKLRSRKPPDSVEIPM